MPVSKQHPILYFLFALAWTGNISAQSFEDEDLALAYGDKSTISIATGNKQAITRAPAVSTVITSRDIEAMGATDLDQALESVPGLHVSKSNIAAKPIYSFRGIHTQQNSQVLMLVNGIPITNIFQGDRGQIWGGMPLENVARIEVIRGPGSALYGADAFSGVINVITKSAEEINGTETGMRAGSANSRDVWIQHGGKLGMLNAAFYLRAGNTNGESGFIQQDSQSVWDACATFGGCPGMPSAIPGYTPVSLAPGHLNTQRKAIDARADLAYQAWRLRMAFQNRDVAVGALAGSLDPNGVGHSSRLYMDLSYEQANWIPNWDMSALVGFYDVHDKPGDPAYTLFPAGSVLPFGTFPNGMIGNPGHSEQHDHASVSAFYTGFEQHRVRVGAGFRIEDMYEVVETKNYDATFAPLPSVVDATGNPALAFMLPHKRNLTYLFAQDEWNLAQDWTLTAGLRHDRYSDFGSTTNPRLALVWDAAYNVVVKAMHGEAFRAPTFVEQYAINNPVQSGSSDIRPETIQTDELAITWQTTPALQTNLNFFHYRMRNIIQLVDAKMQNAGDQSGRGLELEATYDAANNLRLTGNLSLQRATDETTGKDAGLAPQRRLFARADWRFAPLWQFGATANHVADRLREPGDTRAAIPVPDYTTVDLILRRERIAYGWDARAVVTNLFNRDAKEPTFMSSGIPSDLPLAGRAVYIQMQLHI